ncbi:MAG: hypothetical protein N2692_02470 [Patescibacteria group bacterium]|jgi:hypothetical protein|nr:hypothetical protein [Patescibacteria group bacterium]
MKNDVKIFILVGLVVLSSALVNQFYKIAQASDQSQTIQVTVTTTLTFSLATNTVALGVLTPGTPIIATTSCSVTTNSNSGWQLSAKRDDANSTLDLDSNQTVDFPDETAWNGSNSTDTPGSNLSFRVYQTGTTPAGLYNSTYWGTNDSSPKWAGFPASSQEIATISTYQSSEQTVVYGFRIDAPISQPSGVYSGTITLTALAI